MAFSARRRLDTLRYRIQRQKTASLTEDAYTRDESRLHTAFDFILVGLAAIFPVSLFVISGHAVKDLAGPSAILSLIFAALASGLAGLSYSELRARVYRLQATAYEYTYRLIGEAVAFAIGWLLVLHHVTCASAVAQAISHNLDYLLENRISNLTIAHLGYVTGIDTYLDFVAFFIVLLTMIASVLDLTLEGRKIRITTIGLTLIATLFVLVVSMYHLNFHRWQDINGFFPQGIGGVMGGAALLSYAFWSSEVVLRSCDLNARALRKPAVRAILAAHVVTLSVLLLVMSAVSLLSSAWSSDTPFAEAFSSAGLPWVRYIICPAAIVVLVPALCRQYRHAVASLGCLAADGLLPELFAGRGSTTHAPLAAIILIGVLCSLCSLVFPVSYVIQVASGPVVIVQIMACVVTVCFHYKPEEELAKGPTRRRRRKDRQKRRDTAGTNGVVSGSTATGTLFYGATVHAGDGGSEADRAPTEGASGGATSSSATTADGVRNPDDGSSSDTDIDDIVEEYQHERCVQQLTENVSPADYRRRSNKASFGRVRAALVVFLCAALVLGLVVSEGSGQLKRHNAVVITLLVLSTIAVLVAAVAIARQPRDIIQPYTVMMYVYHVPWTPLVALVMNVMMLSGLGAYPALATLFWIILGTALYIFYGISHSHEAMYPEDFPEEQRGLVSRMSTSSDARQSTGNVSHSVPDDTIHLPVTDRDDEPLLDCT